MKKKTRTYKRKGTGAKNPGHFARTHKPRSRNQKQFTFKEGVQHIVSLACVLIAFLAIAGTCATLAYSSLVSDGPGAFSQSAGTQAGSPLHSRWEGPADPCGTAAIGGGCALPHSKTPQEIQVRKGKYSTKCGKTYSQGWDLGTKWGGIVCERPQYAKQLKKQGFRRLPAIKKGSHHEPPIN